MREKRNKKEPKASAVARARAGLHHSEVIRFARLSSHLPAERCLRTLRRRRTGFIADVDAQSFDLGPYQLVHAGNAAVRLAKDSEAV